MALINCPECGNEISDQATACPHCGNPVTTDTAKLESIRKASPFLFSEPTKLPIRIVFYYILKSVIFLMVISSPALFFSWASFVGLFVSLLEIIWLLWIYWFIEVSSERFSLSSTEITVSGGIFNKYSKTTGFAKIQNVTLHSGIIMRLFSLERISIWTSSPGQISIREGNSKNRPEISLILDQTDARDVKELLSTA